MKSSLVNSTALRHFFGFMWLTLAIVPTFAPIIPASAEDASKEEPKPFYSPTEIHSVNGVLNTTLEVKEQKIKLGHIDVDGAVYNGEYAGPVLRVSPGDVMNIHLVNHMSRPTNLHFHGLRTSPQGHSDNMHVVVNPGETYDYVVKIPEGQPPGLYWYHDHIHTVSEKNVMQGLSGALIVEGISKEVPALKNVKEHLFVLKDYELDDRPDPYFHKLAQSINGQVYSSIDMRPGETQLWRFTNQSANQYFNLTLPGHIFRVIAEDSGLVKTEVKTEHLKIRPASRVDVLVEAGQAGSYTMLSEGVVTGTGPDKTFDRPLLAVHVSGKNMTPLAEMKLPDSQDLSDAKIDAKREFVFSQQNDDEHYFINGKEFDHHRIDTRVPLGNTEEWTIKNDSDDLHVFHIHQLSFQVMSVNGEAQAFNGYVDTVRVPERGTVVLRMAFVKPEIVGKFMYHCHVLKHEDHGMMANIEIYDPKAELALATH